MTLSKDEIIERIKPGNKDFSEKIIITPIFDFKNQIGPCGIDIRLGKQFLLFKEHIQDIFDPKVPYTEKDINRYQEETIIPIGENIILHPGKLLIASSLEYVSIPLDIECQVEGRSSWARLGLIIATATTVEPGYKGVITFELSNIGKIPIKLYPGVRIAQLIFHKLDRNMSSNTINIDDKKYNCSIGPEISKIYLDEELNYFCKKNLIY